MRQHRLQAFLRPAVPYQTFNLVTMTMKGSQRHEGILYALLQAVDFLSSMQTHTCTPARCMQQLMSHAAGKPEQLKPSQLIRCFSTIWWLHAGSNYLNMTRRAELW